MRRLTRLLLAALSVLCGLALVLGAGASAYADEGPSGTKTPPSKPGDPFNGATLPPGDTFVVTPGDGASELGEPADPEAVQSQVDADADGVPDAATTGASPTPGSTTAPDGDGTPGAGVGDPADPEDASAPAADGGEGTSGPAWWTYLVGAAALAALGAAAWRFRRARADSADSADRADGAGGAGPEA